MVDEGALIRALDEGLVRGAGLDVLSSEKPDLNHHPLLHRTNVQLTPHAAFYSEQSIEYLQKKTVANAVDIAWGGNMYEVLKTMTQAERIEYIARDLVSILSVNGTSGEVAIANRVEMILRSFPYFQNFQNNYGQKD